MKTLYSIGIDFGTSNTCVCFASYNLHDDGSVDPVPMKRPEALSMQHADTIPTVIFLGDETGQQTLFGEIAEERAVFYPELTRAGFKMNLGKATAEGTEAYLLTKEFMGYLRGKVADYVPLDRVGDEIQVETYVGHPVQWTADQREETLRAAREAGFPNVRIDGESMAAVFCHLCETGSAVLRTAGSLVMMIDMGGGTTDFAFLRLSSNPKEAPISVPVDPALVAEPWGGSQQRSYGGRDLDRLLLDYFLRGWGYHEPPADYPLLMREVRRFKERFSTNMAEGIDVYQSAWLVNGEQKVVHLDRETFERITSEYRSYFPRLVRASLELAGVRAEEVSAIILTGGHSRWYFVQSVVRQIFPQCRPDNYTLLRHNHPEQSVARGLCYNRMVMAQSGENKAVRRKAAHSVWVGISPVTDALATTVTNVGLGTSELIDQEPLLVMPEGQLLPFRTGTPVTLSIQRLALNSREAAVSLRLYSGIQGGSRVPLLDRTARFQRGLFEDVWKRVSRRLPWASNADEDRYVVDVFCKVDENEIISGKVVITRYWRERVMAVQTQPLRIDTARRLASAPTAMSKPAMAAV